MVSERNMEMSCFLPVCADHTAMAIVKLLASRTTVLNPPSFRLRVLLPIANAWKYTWRLSVYAIMMPPKNITSVTRKIHMPSEAVSFCCARVLYCPYSSPVRCIRTPLTVSFRREQFAHPRSDARVFFNRLREQALAPAHGVHRDPVQADCESRTRPR